MASARKNNDRLTESQKEAVDARGNVLVMAGAGTGKTHTLVERCLECIGKERASLDEILVVTFTEFAATEMRRRLRRALDEKSRENPGDPFFAEQLALFDTAHIGTLHSFCLKLIRENFHTLELDPQLAVLDEGQSRLLADETLDELFESHYAGKDEFSAAVQDLIQAQHGGRDEKVRMLVLHLHNYMQTRADAGGWLAREIEKFSTPGPVEWRELLPVGIADWRDEWLPALENLRAGNIKAAECLDILKSLSKKFSREDAAEILKRVILADEEWPPRKKTILREPLKKFFEDATFLNSLAPVANDRDPLAEDWGWARGRMMTLLELAREFTKKLSERKHADGALDFHDLEQFALKLLWDYSADKPTALAERWREKIRFVFVDEYQDINAAQDKIIEALSRTDAKANRFLVGDVKQSIYRFRLADPKIFRAYAENWRDKKGRTIPLTENFRSRESLLHVVNSFFEPLMHSEAGGVAYDDEAKLKFGSPETREAFSVAKDPSPRAELILRIKNGHGENSFEDESEGDGLANMEESEKEARLLALRLSGLKKSGHEIWDDEKRVFRAVEWRDMAVLLRSPSGRAEVFAKQFERAGVPLHVERGGFYDSREILDLLSLLQLLDNPLQDVPAIAVLHSPLAGLSLDELAEIRLAAGGHFWFALNQSQNPKSKIGKDLRAKVGKFLGQFSQWRKLARQVSLSQCLETVLGETHYDDWLRAQPRGAQRRANIAQFLNLAQKFDQFQRQGLFRFVKFIKAQREAEVEPEVSPVGGENAVRLMSIHQSKGLEFPVVAVACLSKPFNMQDLNSDIILDEAFGLCPRIQPPHSRSRYPGLTHWLAQRRQRRELLGEELRLLYVAMTRARDTLVLTASITQKKWDELWNGPDAFTPREIVGAKSCADWLGLWFAQHAGETNGMEGEKPQLSWRIASEDELAVENAVEKGPEMELPVLDDTTKRQLQNVLSWEYGFGAATRQAAKSSVTALRRQAEELDDEGRQMFVPDKFVRSKKSTQGKLSAADAGTAMHKFLQNVALEKAGDLASLKAEAQRMEKADILSADEHEVLDLDAVAAFWNSESGKKILKQSGNVERELAFTARFSPEEVSKINGKKADAGLEDEFVVVQGVADLAVVLPKEIWLVDFKTDKVDADGLPAKTEYYEPQLKLYAQALGKIYSRPVTNCWLHFLHARKTVTIKV